MRKDFYNVIYAIYSNIINNKKSKIFDGIENAKANHKYLGRKPIKVDMVVFNDRINKVQKKQLTRIDVMKELSISKDKYYRLRKELKK